MGYSLHLVSGRCKPIARVNWFEALCFCNLLSQREGLETCYHGLPKDFKAQWHRGLHIQFNPKAGGYRLPNEAEWEYIAKGQKYTIFSGNNSFEMVGWGVQDSQGQLRPVGQKQANSAGIYDMNGLLREWCNDAWDGSYKEGYDTGGRRGVDPLVWKDAPTPRVTRGGNFLDISGKTCRNSARNGLASEKRNPLQGMRIVRTLTE